MADIITSKNLIARRSTYVVQLLICALAAAVIVLIFFAPRFIAWQGLDIPETWSSPETNRAVETLRLLDDPLGYQPGPSNHVIVWRLLFVLPWHYLSLPKSWFLAMPMVGCVPALMMVAHIVQREAKSWILTWGVTALTATSSWFFVATGWLTYFDAWVLLGLLAVSFVRHIGWGVLACVLVPWVDERFVLALPLALTVRAMMFEHIEQGQSKRLLMEGFWLVLALLPWVGIRGGLTMMGIDRGMGEAVGKPFDMNELSEVPQWRFIAAWWMGLRGGWVLIPCAILLWPGRRRMGWVGLWVTVMVVTLVLALFVAGDMSRSMSMFVPMMLAGAVLLIRQRMNWAAWVLPMLLLLNLALPATHVMWSYRVAIAPLREEIQLMRERPNMLYAGAIGRGAQKLVKHGNLSQALAQLDRALALDPRSGNLHANRAVVLYQMGEMGAALADAQEAIRLEPNQPEGYWVRGNLLLRMNQPLASMEDLQRVIRLSPKGEPLHQAAQKALEKAQQTTPPPTVD